MALQYYVKLYEEFPAKIAVTAREVTKTVRATAEVRQLVDTGEIPAARFGPRRVIRIARSALVRVLRGRQGRRT
jgi:hypothetical protein